MIDKQVSDVSAALDGIGHGATVMISGFGETGLPEALIDGLRTRGVGGLTVVNNNAGTGSTGIAALLRAGLVSKVICSFPRQVGSTVFDDLYRAGDVELEIVPQGTLAERIRAAGAGIGGFFTPTGFGTEIAAGKETREIDGRNYVFEFPLFADIALISAFRADRLGNLVYRKTSRNFGPIMATAASITIVQVDEIVDAGSLDPETIITPGIFVDRVVAIGSRFENELWAHVR
jgi:3-oxoadipate CoA-transferase alpha subunit